MTKTLCHQTEKLAQQDGVPLQHLNSSAIDKETRALQLAQSAQRTSGRVALLTCVESCSTYRLRKNNIGYVKPVKERGKCLHYYHYFLHSALGLCYVRVQSWFPFAIRIGMNGRQWLYRQLEERGVPFQRRNNLLLSVADPALAQKLLDDQRRTDWPTVLGNLVHPVQPLWDYLQGPAGTPYYWMTEQSEWATDFLFRSPSDLAEHYPGWIKYGIETLQCRDVLRYLGKKVTPNGHVPSSDEVKIDLRQRPEGTRLKFWHGTNSLKIYDKEAHALRIETTINQPQGYKVFRTKEGQEDDAPKSWQIMRKGVADLDRRAEVSHAANNRLAESLASVAQTTTLGELLKPLGQPVIEEGRRKARALNPLTGADGGLLRALAQGAFLVNGFRNRDIRVSLHGQPPTAIERRRQAAQITRQLALLRAHGLIVKVPKSHRYHLSALGRRISAVLSAAHAADITRLAESA